MLLIVSEIMIIWYECCWVILVMIIHALGVNICVVVVIKFLCLMVFVKMGKK